MHSWTRLITVTATALALGCGGGGSGDIDGGVNPTIDAPTGPVIDGSTSSAQGATNDVDIDNISVEANLGIFAAKSGAGIGGRVDVTNSSFSGGALWYQGGTTGLIQGNTIDCGHGSACIRMRSGLSTTQPEPIRIIANHIVQPPGGGNRARAIWLTALDAGPFEVRDNFIDGGSLGGDRSDPFDYSFQHAAVHSHGAEVVGLVTDNTIVGAYRGLLSEDSSAKIAVDDNTVTTTWTVLSLLNGGQMSAYSNDLTDYVVPIDPSEPFADGDLTCNWWGDAAGPQGVDPAIAPAVFTPWAAASVAGTGSQSC